MTKEERAKNYAGNYVVGDAAIITDLLHEVAFESYQAGETEQDPISRADERKKVIEKAWSIFEEMVDECEGKGYCEKRYITKEQFKSAMEE